jgi:hypothetical protein
LYGHVRCTYPKIDPLDDEEVIVENMEEDDIKVKQ